MFLVNMAVNTNNVHGVHTLSRMDLHDPYCRNNIAYYFPKIHAQGMFSCSPLQFSKCTNFIRIFDSLKWFYSVQEFTITYAICWLGLVSVNLHSINIVIIVFFSDKFHCSKLQNMSNVWLLNRHMKTRKKYFSILLLLSYFSIFVMLFIHFFSYNFNTCNAIL